MRRRLAVLGSTGSVGGSALEVARHHPDRLQIVALAANGRHLDTLVEQVEEFEPAIVALSDPDRATELRERIGAATRVVAGGQGLIEATVDSGADRVVAAIVGAAGLRPVHAAIDAGIDVALANKESLVAAGRLLTRLASERGAAIIPVDSEHVALHQTLAGRPRESVRRLVLTASGGPFRGRDPGSWQTISPAEALQHPTWEMGAKISVDSATLMNKALELIEAVHLFDLPEAQIDVVVHPQSLVHSLVEFCDGAWLAQISVNDMVFPVQYALAFPDRWCNEFERLDPTSLGGLEFEELDEEAFGAVALARQVLGSGESAAAVFNAANEVAVRHFLDGTLSFDEIVPTVERVLSQHPAMAVETLEAALEWDAWGRRRAEELLSRP